MSFSVMGSVGQKRHRIHPRKVKGPSGYKGQTVREPEVTRTHRKLYEEPKKGIVSKVSSRLKSLFRRGAK